MPQYRNRRPGRTIKVPAPVPYEEIPRLDLAAVAAAQGHHDEADRIVRDDVCNRSDDNLPPIELSLRTAAILRARDWPRPRKAAS